MSVFIVTVDRELEPEISQNAVLLAVHGRRERGEEQRVRVYQGGELPPNATEDEKKQLILACLCRVRDYQSDDVAVAFANSWLFQTWEGIQVIGQISDGCDITYSVEELPPTVPLTPSPVDISIPEPDQELPPFDPELAATSLTDQWSEPATPVSNEVRRQSASPVEGSHRMGKRQRDE